MHQLMHYSQASTQSLQVHFCIIYMTIQRKLQELKLV